MSPLLLLLVVLVELSDFLSVYNLWESLLVLPSPFLFLTSVDRVVGFDGDTSPVSGSLVLESREVLVRPLVEELTEPFLLEP